MKQKHSVNTRLSRVIGKSQRQEKRSVEEPRGLHDSSISECNQTQEAAKRRLSLKKTNSSTNATGHYRDIIRIKARQTKQSGSPQSQTYTGEARSKEPANVSKVADQRKHIAQQCANMMGEMPQRRRQRDSRPGSGNPYTRGLRTWLGHA